MLKNLSKLKIEKRLSKSFTLVSLITSIAAVIGLIALIITTTQYSNALKNYGFTQGDIGKALVTFADTRAAILKMMYEQDHLLYLENLEPEGTKITIWIPKTLKCTDNGRNDSGNAEPGHSTLSYAKTESEITKIKQRVNRAAQHFAKYQIGRAHV